MKPQVEQLENRYCLSATQAITVVAPPTAQPGDTIAVLVQYQADAVAVGVAGRLQAQGDVQLANVKNVLPNALVGVQSQPSGLLMAWANFYGTGWIKQGTLLEADDVVGPHFTGATFSFKQVGFTPGFQLHSAPAHVSLPTPQQAAQVFRGNMDWMIGASLLLERLESVRGQNTPA